MSSVIRSGLTSGIRARARLPFPAVPATTISGSDASSSLSNFRITAESSTINMRTGCMFPCPEALPGGGDELELFANWLSNKHALAMSAESLLANTFSIGTALPSLEHRNRADVVLRFSPSTQSHGRPHQIRKLSPCGSIIPGMEHAQCPNGHAPGTWNRLR